MAEEFEGHVKFYNSGNKYAKTGTNAIHKDHKPNLRANENYAKEVREIELLKQKEQAEAAAEMEAELKLQMASLEDHSNKRNIRQADAAAAAKVDYTLARDPLEEHKASNQTHKNNTKKVDGGHGNPKTFGKDRQRERDAKSEAVNAY